MADVMKFNGLLPKLANMLQNIINLLIKKEATGKTK